MKGELAAAQLCLCMPTVEIKDEKDLDPALRKVKG